MANKNDTGTIKVTFVRFLCLIDHLRCLMVITSVTRTAMSESMQVSEKAMSMT